MNVMSGDGNLITAGGFNKKSYFCLVKQIQYLASILKCANKKKYFRITFVIFCFVILLLQTILRKTFVILKLLKTNS